MVLRPWEAGTDLEEQAEQTVKAGKGRGEQRWYSQGGREPSIRNGAETA